MCVLVYYVQLAICQSNTHTALEDVSLSAVSKMKVSIWICSFPVKQTGSIDTTIVAEDCSESGNSGEPESRQRVSALQSKFLRENGYTASQGKPKVGEGRLKAPLLPNQSVLSPKWWVLPFVLYLHKGQGNET